MIRSKSGRFVVFDLDDTLYDEIDFVQSGFMAVADDVRKHFGIDCSAVFMERVKANRLAGTFQEAVRRHGLPVDALALMIETYRSHEPDIRLREGAGEVLTGLRRMDGVLGCITDGRGVTQRNKIKSLGLVNAFDVLLISEEVGHGKPDPFSFQEIMRRVHAKQYWYVADNSLKDFIAPNSLSWRTVGVRANRAIHTPELTDLTDHHHPEGWVSALGELSEYLESRSPLTGC